MSDVDTPRASRWTEYQPLDEVQRALRNPKSHSPEIGVSIARFGLIEAITLDERTGRLISGHGRLERLTTQCEAGEEPPDGVEVAEDGSWLVPVQRGWASRSDADAEAALIALNAIGPKGGWDRDLLAELLGDYQGNEDWLEGTGYDVFEVGALLKDMAPPEPPDDFPSYDEGIETTYECPKCGYAWSGSSATRVPEPVE